MRTTTRRKVASFVTGSGLVVLAAGCVSPNRIDRVALNPHIEDSYDQAASVHVAVLSNTPFDRIKNDLQPVFAMDAEKAAQEVVPNTQLLVERVLDVVQRSLSLTTQQTSTTSTTTINSGTGVEPTTTRQTTDTREPGDIPDAPTFPGGDSTAAGLSAATPAAPSERAIDPFTKYRAAAALMQEIKLLNQYVIAQQLPKGTVAQVVRLQISVLPYARNQPYDVYTNVSFFPEEVTQNERALLSVERRKDEPGMSDTGATGVALVIPLLATDNFEASSQSSAADSVQQAAFALLGLVQGMGLNAANSRVLDELRAVTGRELNALMTVSRLTNNTLRVRLGAPFSNRAGYAMVPQTHNISAVVIVPEDSTGVNVVARTALRNATTGDELPSRQRSETARLACERLAGYPELPGNPLKKLTNLGDKRDSWSRVCSRMTSDGPLIDADNDKQVDDLLQEAILDLLQNVEFGRFYQFRRTVVPKPDAEGRGNSLTEDEVRALDDAVTALWAGFAELLTGSRYSRTWFPVVKTNSTWPAPQTIIAVDDGRLITATATNGRDLPSNALTATLYLRELKGNGANQADVPCRSTDMSNEPDVIDYEATLVQVQSGLSGLTMSFPSASLLARKANTGVRGCLVLKAAAAQKLKSWENGADAAAMPYSVLIQQRTPDVTPKPTLVLSATAIGATSSGEASVRVSVRDKGGDEVYVRVTGADIVSTVPDPNLTPMGAKLTAAGPFTFNLANVKEGNDVIFTLLAKDGKTVLHEVRVDVWTMAPNRATASSGGREPTG